MPTGVTVAAVDPHWKRLLIGLGVAFGVLVVGVCLGLPGALLAAGIAGVITVFDARNKTALAAVRIGGILLGVLWLFIGVVDSVNR
jgi:uncharacterized membrane protein